jgi:hypothetical protein
MPFRITPPTQLTLLISVALALLALVVRFAGIDIPVVGNPPFAVLLIGYLVLLVGNLMDGI